MNKNAIFALFLVAGCGTQSVSNNVKDNGNTESIASSASDSITDQQIIALAEQTLNEIECVEYIVRDNAKVTARRISDDEGEAIVRFRVFVAEGESIDDIERDYSHKCNEKFWFDKRLKTMVGAIRDGKGIGTLNYTIKFKRWDTGWRPYAG